MNNLKVLIVDDHMLMRNMIKMHAQSYGFEKVEFCNDGQQALDELSRDRYNIIFADWNMPVMTGHELLKNIRSKPEYAKLAFVMITAESEQRHVLDIMRNGATAYITKPFTKETFDKHLKNVLIWLSK